MILFLKAPDSTNVIIYLLKLFIRSRSLSGYLPLCVKEYAEAFEIVPYTLAENAGMKPLEIVTELRRAHSTGDCNRGINVKKVGLHFCSL
jgi:T-complex protein 1 subunit delta